MRKGAFHSSPCERDAEVIRQHYNDPAPTDMDADTLMNRARCSFHRKVEERRSYGSVPYFSVTVDMVEKVNAELTRRRAEAAEARKVQDAENKRLHGERVAREWANLTAEGPTTYGIESKVEVSEWANRTDYEYAVARRDNGRTDWSIIVRDVSRYDDIPEPVSIEVHRTGSLTPEEARALAIALTTAAMRADQLNSTKVFNA